MPSAVRRCSTAASGSGPSASARPRATSTSVRWWSDGGSASARFEEGRGRLGRAPLDRGPRGAEQLRHRPLVPDRRCLEEMGAHCLARGTLVREQPSRARMEHCTGAGRLVFEDRRAYHRVDELERHRRREHAEVDQRVGEPRSLGGIQLGERGHVTQLGCLTHQRRGLNEAACAGHDPADASQTGLRDAPRPQQLDDRSGCRRRGEPLRAQSRAQLTEQERVALSGAMARGDEFRIAPTQPLGDECR